MASSLYPKGILTLLTSSVHLEDGNLMLLPVKGTFAFDNTDEFLDDVSAFGADGMAAASLSDAVASLATATLIKLDATDTPLLWEGIDDADDIGGSVVYYDTGSSATSFLIAFLDSVDFETDGSNVQGILNSSGILGIQC